MCFVPPGMRPGPPIFPSHALDSFYDALFPSTFSLLGFSQTFFRFFNPRGWVFGYLAPPKFVFFLGLSSSQITSKEPCPPSESFFW